MKPAKLPGMPRTAAPWNRPIFVAGMTGGMVDVNYNGKAEKRPYLVCLHCRSRVALNPNRRREREHCVACNNYLCDDCARRRRACPQAEGATA